MRRRNSLLVAVAVVLAASLISFSLALGKSSKKHIYPPTPSTWTGYNSQLSHYYVAPGYPSYEAHPRYLGELTGSWEEIGKQYGEKAGDLIRMVYEGWYRELLAVQGSPQAIVAYVHQEETYYEALVPEALELMKGMAEGAKDDLGESAYAGVMTNYEKILMINSYFGLQAKPPLASGVSCTPSKEIHSCSGAVILGAATKDGKTIHVSSEDQHFFPQEYLVTFVVNPRDKNAHRFTVTDSAGEIGSEHAMNDQGVSVSGYAGGSIDVMAPTLSAPFSGYRKPGLDWQVGDFYAIAFANSAKKAVELLTVGRPEYRKKSGKKIVIGKCSKGANWVISDKHEAYVVESIPADQNGIARYAVRAPGDLGEKNASYIVSTNNVEAKYSCNEDNQCDKSHPMSQHGNSTQDPTPYFGLNGTGMRFWTFMWLINNNYGNISADIVKEWRTTHYVYDLAGTKHDYLLEDGKKVGLNLVPEIATLCWHANGPARVDTYKGVDTYVTVSVAQDLTSYRTRGRPCEWVGPWDTLSLSSKP